MPKDKPQPVIKKKVKPYPFAATLEVNGAKKVVEVMFLSPNGFIARLKNPAIVQVGEYYQTVFELPVSHSFVNTQVRVMKTYDRSTDAKTLVIDRMAEVHFETLSEDHRKNILSFLSAIGQK